jgi:hypothetical protein
MANLPIKRGGCADVLESQLADGEICPVCVKAARIKSYQTVATMPLPQVNQYVATFQAQIAQNPNDPSLDSTECFGGCYGGIKKYNSRKNSTF